MQLQFYLYTIAYIILLLDYNHIFIKIVPCTNFDMENYFLIYEDDVIKNEVEMLLHIRHRSCIFLVHKRYCSLYLYHYCNLDYE